MQVGVCCWNSFTFLKWNSFKIPVNNLIKKKKLMVKNSMPVLFLTTFIITVDFVFFKTFSLLFIYLMNKILRFRGRKYFYLYWIVIWIFNFQISFLIVDFMKRREYLMKRDSFFFQLLWLVTATMLAKTLHMISKETLSDSLENFKLLKLAEVLLSENFITFFFFI